jgi:hypothetical protein
LLEKLKFLTYKCHLEWSVLLTQYRAGDKIEKNEMGGACSEYGGGEAYTVFWWGNLNERDHWGYPGVDERIILRRIFGKWDMRVGTGSIWLRIGTCGGHL